MTLNTPTAHGSAIGVGLPFVVAPSNQIDLTDQPGLLAATMLVYSGISLGTTTLLIPPIWRTIRIMFESRIVQIGVEMRTRRIRTEPRNTEV